MTASGRRTATGRRLRWLAVLALQAVLALALAELALRLFRPAPRGYSPLYRFDAELGYTVAEDLDLDYQGSDYQVHISTDELGARRHPPAAGRPTGAPLTVMVLGDSYTFGIGVDDDQTWPYHLEQLLADALPGTTARVVNLGVPGYGLTQMRLLAERHFEALNPRLLVVMMCSNDPGDDLGFSLGADHSRGLHVDPHRLDGNPTELRRYLDIALKRFDLLRPLWLPAWRIPLREREWRQFAPRYADIARREFGLLARLADARPVLGSLINYEQLEERSAAPDSLAPGTLPHLQRRLLLDYVRVAGEHSRYVSLADTGIFDADGRPRRELWNQHSGHHLSPLGNRTVAAALLPAVLDELGPPSAPAS